MSRAIPQRCAGRPLSGGLVVPWISLVHGGHAVFGSMDAARAPAAFHRRAVPAVRAAA
ncbi:hypothetical protein [Streptomyces minutiscleroticus]|uniref:hypothetical protein n=1 Tax=Streptomyces minutiscleroticus TaxID=68238 RepID=UPI001E424DA7|nr:hypothetical protein [Streptomyces minutiscleroticus]